MSNACATGHLRPLLCLCMYYENPLGRGSLLWVLHTFHIHSRNLYDTDDRRSGAPAFPGLSAGRLVRHLSCNVIRASENLGSGATCERLVVDSPRVPMACVLRMRERREARRTGSLSRAGHILLPTRERLSRERSRETQAVHAHISWGSAGRSRERDGCNARLARRPIFSP